MAELSLSTEIVNKVLKVINEHDASASDSLVATQYLAAIIGCVVSKENFPDAQREDVINELSSFIRYVVDDLRGAEQNNTAAAPTGEAFGIWKPE